MVKLSKTIIKKKFFPVEIPILRKQIELYGQDITEFRGKTIKINLANELHGKALDIRLKVDMERDKAIATPIEIKLLSSYLKRTTRKGTDYAENSFIAECKDAKIKIKTLAITRKRVTKKVLVSLAKTSKEEIEKYLKDKKFEDIINEILSNKLQKQLMTKLKKIYPLNTFEIKQFAVYTKEEYSEEKEQQKEEAKKAKQEAKEKAESEESKAGEQKEETK